MRYPPANITERSGIETVTYTFAAAQVLTLSLRKFAINTTTYSFITRQSCLADCSSLSPNRSPTRLAIHHFRPARTHHVLHFAGSSTSKKSFAGGAHSHRTPTYHQTSFTRERFQPHLPNSTSSRSWENISPPFPSSALRPLCAFRKNHRTTLPYVISSRSR